MPHYGGTPYPIVVSGITLCHTGMGVTDKGSALLNPRVGVEPHGEPI